MPALPPELIVADHVALDLHPEPYAALTRAEMTDGLGLDGAVEQLDWKKVRDELRSQWELPCDLINGLLWRTESVVTDPAVARRYQPSRNRPAEGIRFRGPDDPFAVAAAEKSARRAIVGIPRTARKLNDAVESGAITEATRDAIIARERQHAEDEITPEIRAAMRRMLPAPE